MEEKFMSLLTLKKFAKRSKYPLQGVIYNADC